MTNKIEFLDTTLRDGAQAVGMSFSHRDKSSIMELLDGFGIQLIECGAANPKDREFLKTVKNNKLTVFGSTRRKDNSAECDSALNGLLEADTQTVCIFGKSGALQAERVLVVTPDENIAIICDSVSYLRSHGKRVIFDAEHFFDAYAQNSDYAISVLKTAAQAGADTVVLCDTNGGTMPWQIYDIVKRVVSELPPSVKTGIHTHNDCGLAVACALSAVKAGALHVQGTFLGFGERCGNANLSSIIADLQLKMNIDTGCDLTRLTATARQIAEIANVRLDEGMPYVGLSSFAHKAGMHVDAVLKDSHTFEHVLPESVGNEQRLVLSDVSGRSAVSHKLYALFPDLDKTNPKTEEILKRIKELERDGFQFDTADGSFTLLAKRMLGAYKAKFEPIGYRITESKPDGVSEAEVRIRVGDTATTVKQSGNGPVNALDKALREALTRHYPDIASITLADYKVRVLDFAAATGAKVRVLITSTDGRSSWTTVGVSTDVIEASWTALKDSFEFRLCANDQKESL